MKYVKISYDKYKKLLKSDLELTHLCNRRVDDLLEWELAFDKDYWDEDEVKAEIEEEANSKLINEGEIDMKNVKISFEEYKELLMIKKEMEQLDLTDVNATSEYEEAFSKDNWDEEKVEAEIEEQAKSKLID